MAILYINSCLHLAEALKRNFTRKTSSTRDIHLLLAAWVVS